MRLIIALLTAAAVHALAAPANEVRIPVPSRASVLVSAVVGLISLLVVPATVAVVAGPVAGLVPCLVARIRAGRTASAAREQWPDFLAVVRSRIGSGEPLPDAVRAAARLLGDSFSDLDRAWGGSFVDELEAARHRWSDPVADRVLTTLRIAATTGGAHVDAVLSALARSLSEEMRIRTAHEAALTQQRLTAGVALIAPWIILALSLATNPQAGAEFATGTGRAILYGGVMATTVGFVLARRASKLSAPPRIFS